MKIGAIVQARITSKRLAGKVLQNVNGKPMLQYLLERLSKSQYLSNIVVATSDTTTDNPITKFCLEKGVSCFRGSLTNVAKRFYRLLKKYNFEAFVRISEDSPLLDQRLVDLGIKIFLDNNYDIVTNVLKRTYPKGQSVEIVKSDAFLDAYKEMKEIEDLEHVTKYFYRNKDNYSIYNFESGEELGQIQLSVDTQQDMDNFRQVLSLMDKPHWEYGYKDIIKIFRKVTENGKSRDIITTILKDDKIWKIIPQKQFVDRNY